MFEQQGKNDLTFSIYNDIVRGQFSKEFMLKNGMFEKDSFIVGEEKYIHKLMEKETEGTLKPSGIIFRNITLKQDEYDLFKEVILSYPNVNKSYLILYKHNPLIYQLCKVAIFKPDKQDHININVYLENFFKG